MEHIVAVFNMNKNTKQCPFCKEKIHVDAIKCRYCGSMLNESSSSTTIIDVFSSRYEIIEEIGRGGMATVYKAQQKRPNRSVALKIIPKEFTHDQEFITRFHREADSAANLNHRNIITIHDEGDIGGYPYMAMEYLEGGTVREKIKASGVFTEAEIKKILLPIIDALGYAHKKGIVHRDIKSSNIMFGENNRPVLMDFGIAKSSEGTKLTKTGTIIGTPEYMSPEQADTDKEVDERSDIYSLGVVLYEMATGRVPFIGDNPITVLHNVVHKAPPDPKTLNKKISSGFRSIISKVLSKDPADRFQDCGEFAKAMRSGKTQSLPVVKPKESVSKKSKAPVKKVSPPVTKAASPNWVKTTINVISVLIIIVLGVILLRRSGGDMTSKDIEQEDVTPVYSTTLPRPETMPSSLSDVQKQRIANMIKDAETHLSAGDLDQAFKVYALIQRTDSSSIAAYEGLQKIYDSYLSIAGYEYQSGNYKGYRATLGTAMKKFPYMQRDNLHMQADRFFSDSIYVSRDQYDARSLYGEIIKNDTTDSIAVIRLTTSIELGMEDCLTDGDYGCFEELGWELNQMIPAETATRYNWMGDKYYIQNRLISEDGLHAAINMYSRALDADPDNPYALKQMELLNYDIQELINTQEDDAKKLILSAGALMYFPNELFYAENIKLFGSIREIEIIIFMIPSDSKGYNYLADIAYSYYRKNGDNYFNFQEWNNAITNYKKAVDYKKEDSYVSGKISKAENSKQFEKYKQEGDKAFNQREWAQAINGYKKALKYNSQDSFLMMRVKDIESMVFDYDGNIYETVEIGEQLWMAENLKTTHYNNGDEIPKITNNGDWDGLSSGAYGDYDNNPTNSETYGRLYNWYTIDDDRGICPEGWHVPSDNEYTVLTDYLGGESVAGGKMKETGLDHWNSPNTGANNESGFSAFPAGYRNTSNGSYYSMGSAGYFWSSSEGNSSSAWSRGLYCNSSNVDRYGASKRLGFSIRCLGD